MGNLKSAVVEDKHSHTEARRHRGRLRATTKPGSYPQIFTYLHKSLAPPARNTKAVFGGETAVPPCSKARPCASGQAPAQGHPIAAPLRGLRLVGHKNPTKSHGNYSHVNSEKFATNFLKKTSRSRRTWREVCPAHIFHQTPEFVSVCADLWMKMPSLLYSAPWSSGCSAPWSCEISAP